MQVVDRDEFKVLFAKLCAGFNLPVTKPREDAYWSGMARMTLAQFSRAIDYALGEHYVDEDLPTTGQLWKIHRGARANAASPQTLAMNPAEILSEHVMRHFGRRLTPTQVRGPWTYLKGPAGEIAGVVVPADGDHAVLRMMLADIGVDDLERPQPALDLR